MELNWNTYETTGKSESNLAEQFVDAISVENDLKFYDDKTAVYFISSNAGTFSSITFWQNALEHSPRFANPGIFPWTLANATSGYIARRFSITGPNYTIIEKEYSVERFISNYLVDKEKFTLKNALILIWELKTNNNQLTVVAHWAILEY